MDKKAKKVIIIGAGSAGLEAASFLQAHNVDVQILEASDHIGGRVLDLKGWTDIPLDLGAEFIHGTTNLHHEYAMKHNIKIVEHGDRSYYMEPGTPVAESEIPEQMLNAVNLVLYAESSAGEKDISLWDQLLTGNFEDKVKHLTAGGLNSYCGVEISKVSRKKFLEYEETFAEEGGLGDYVIAGGESQHDLLKKAYKSVWNKVQKNTVVTKIDVSGSVCKVHDKAGKVYEADRVVLTVPISILKRKDITFVPELDKEYQDSIQKIGIAGQSKIILKFKKRFWPEELCVIIREGLFQIMWASGSNGKSENNDVLTIHVVGELAQKLSTMKHEDIFKMALEDMTSTFGKDPVELFDKGFFFDWTNREFIRGGYTYPSVGEGDARKVFSKPFKGKMLFAGEGYREIGTTVATAMQSGREAASYILNIENTKL